MVVVLVPALVFLFMAIKRAYSREIQELSRV
jgi:hypothetical protein